MGERFLLQLGATTGLPQYNQARPSGTKANCWFKHDQAGKVIQEGRGTERRRTDSRHRGGARQSTAKENLGTIEKGTLQTFLRSGLSLPAGLRTRRALKFPDQPRVQWRGLM